MRELYDSDPAEDLRCKMCCCYGPWGVVATGALLLGFSVQGAMAPYTPYCFVALAAMLALGLVHFAVRRLFLCVEKKRKWNSTNNPVQEMRGV
jgi:hypothetical protein